MSEHSSRILERERLPSLREEERGKKLVFTNGCFDLLHRGHLELLSAARRLGDLLVVGLNSDSSVRGIKGAGRPLVGQEDRAYVLLQLRSVDYVTIFDEETPREVIEALRPDLLVKGAEYGTGEIVGESFVEGYGGRVVRIDMVEGYSTTRFIERLKETT
jgi:D-beta-D-heptose 7-phosphate kinase/D-beta-D-heptose 1-phosphate adenosyltransferase